MPRFALLQSTLKSLLHRRQREADLEDEYRDHWNQEVESNLQAGLSPDEAEWAARRLIGPASLHKEACRDAWGTRLLENVVRDSHYALRSLRKNAAFSLIAILALALGIGASTAIFTLTPTVVFAPLPFPNASRLVQIETVSGKTGQPGLWALYADLSDWKARSHSFQNMGGYGFALLNLPADPPAALYGVRVTYDLFPPSESNRNWGATSYRKRIDLAATRDHPQRQSLENSVQRRPEPSWQKHPIGWSAGSR